MLISVQENYQMIRNGSGWIDRSSRFRLEIHGPDRAKFLHNLTTNDVKRLQIGRGCEAFVTSLQGKTLGFLSILATDSRLVVRSDVGAWDHLSAHFQKYGLFDDVSWEDVSDQTFEYHVAGPSADDLLRRLDLTRPELVDLAHLDVSIDGQPVRLIRENPTARGGLTLVGPRSHADAIRRTLGEALGTSEIDAETFEILRIEAGTPIFGRDVTPDNLPQEIARDARAINFVKGCYLGQETVARIDALGHVNKLLRGVRIEGAAVPPEGSGLEIEGKSVGVLTSTAFSPGWDQPIALGFVRSTHSAAETRLAVVVNGERIPAEVSDLPMVPPMR
jgi:tRNA-modifying protein YgfZ